jgi:oligosaccharide amylase
VITHLAGNGRVLLAVNEDGEWTDLFYPYPGQFQHLLESRLGVFDVDGNRFAWLRGAGGFLTRAATEASDETPRYRWAGDGMAVALQDRVHPNHDLVLRTIQIESERARRLRLFSYQSLKIAESLYQETAYLDPAAAALVHYKRGFYFEFFSDPSFDQAVCGEHTLKGLRGTYVDAEDGVLQGRTIAHGAADSVLQWNVAVAPDAPATIRFLVALGQGREEARQVHEYVRAGGAPRFEREAAKFWRSWATRRLPGLPRGLSEEARTVYRQSILMMRLATGSNGAIIASPDTRSLVIGGDTYNYCWWRDGGYISKAMDEAGLYQHAQRFLEFARACQSPDGSFLHRHFPDGAIGSTWHPPPFLQIDQTATVIAATWHHFKRGEDPDVLLDLWPMVKAAANFLTEFRDPLTGLPGASFDLWEERHAIHAYSTAAVVHALERAARIAEQLGKDPSRWRASAKEMHATALESFWDEGRTCFVRAIEPRDERLDASLLLALKLGLLPVEDPRYGQTVDAIERRLWSPSVGGLARYEGDEYYGKENPWVICTLWLAEARLRLGDRDRCRDLIEWVVQRATPTRLLPEQVDARSGEPRSATPLTWSHSTFVDVVHKYQQSMRDGRPSEE